MAENIARDPAFAQMTAALQQSMPPGGAGMPGAAPGAAGPAAAAFDPSQYMEAMSGVLQNPAFMNMAEQLGSKIMQVLLRPNALLTASAGKAPAMSLTYTNMVLRASKEASWCFPDDALPQAQQNPEMMAMMSGMQDPTYREAIEGKLQNLKNDPELEKIMAEIESGGPAAMMKCVVWVRPAFHADATTTHAAFLLRGTCTHDPQSAVQPRQRLTFRDVGSLVFITQCFVASNGRV